MYNGRKGKRQCRGNGYKTMRQGTYQTNKTRNKNNSNNKSKISNDINDLRRVAPKATIYTEYVPDISFDIKRVRVREKKKVNAAKKRERQKKRKKQTKKKENKNRKEWLKTTPLLFLIVEILIAS